MIKENIKRIFDELPEGVELVAAAKTRSAQEILEALDAGVSLIGENYLQETESVFPAVGSKARWHFIGHLQKNKVKKAVQFFDMIETVDSVELAREIDKRSGRQGKSLSVLIEINSGREPQKFGVLPEDAEPLIRALSVYSNIQIQGVMTMGPYSGDPEEARPYFVETRRIFEHIGGLGLPNVGMDFLSMGMSNSYRIAIEEGANLIRLGTKIFGPR